MPGQELVDPVDRVIGDAGEDVTQVGFGVDAVQFAGFDQAVDDGCAVATGIGAGEEPVFPAEGDAAQGVFSAVVVDLQAAVLGIAGQRRPVGRGVADRLGKAALGRQPGSCASNQARKAMSRGLACSCRTSRRRSGGLPRIAFSIA